MKIPAFVLLLLGLLGSCQSADDLPPAPPADKRFAVSDPSRLYFNNIRSTSYELTELPERYTKLYTLSQWPDTAHTGFPVLTIVDYWLHDQAYVDLEWRGLQQDLDLPWTLVVKTSTQTDTLKLSSKRWGDQHDFAQRINEGLMKNGSSFQLISAEGEAFPVLTDDELKRLFRLSWKDYLELTDSNK